MTTYAETAVFTLPPVREDEASSQAILGAARAELRNWRMGEWSPPYLTFTADGKQYRLSALSGDNNWIISAE